MHGSIGCKITQVYKGVKSRFYPFGIIFLERGAIMKNLKLKNIIPMVAYNTCIALEDNNGMHIKTIHGHYADKVKALTEFSDYYVIMAVGSDHYELVLILSKERYY